MRPSARVPSALAALVLAAGGVLAAAPQASAGVQDCQQYLAAHAQKVPSGAAEACYEGSIGNQTSCTSTLEGSGLPATTATAACRASR
ncbi:hypothetical protein [Streptomyces sp. WAC06614]|uniref:hypothetical protein n=1 Tax=Streptomyces sp. WAC06614 TaxID=2487416 RepID=UPI000F799F5D|nr:hypothetical protein [Streptomyces sp. WAC06614]RSS82403.1 hypothetical protein EF918_07240 [Streptomyces sp. WAC06614]